MPVNNNNIIFSDLGIIDFKDAWEYQEKLFNEIINIKLKNKKPSVKEPSSTPSYLLFCEHPHVYTLGKSGTENNLLINTEDLEKRGATFYHINRGGDITYHGPGQIVGYPILDLENYGLSLKGYIELLEDSVIDFLSSYKIKASRLQGATGVWLDAENPGRSRKICAIGVRASRYVTMHGFALNINTNLDFFNYINPCGFTDKGVTSLEKELGKPQEMELVKDRLKKILIERLRD